MRRRESSVNCIESLTKRERERERERESIKVEQNSGIPSQSAKLE